MAQSVKTLRSVDYLHIMLASKDWWALAEEALPRAKAGEPGAQYLIWVIHEDCHSPLSAYLTDYKSRKALNLDEALQKAALNNRPADKVAEFYSRCHKFFTDATAGEAGGLDWIADSTPEFGNPLDWLERSAAGGYAPAQANLVHYRFLQDGDIAYEKAGTGPQVLTRVPLIGGDKLDSHALLQVAIKSGDPEVMKEIGDLQNLLSPSQSRQDRTTLMFAWRYVSCQRGADCSFWGDPVTVGCEANDTHCTPVPSQWLMAVHNDWNPIAQKAAEINSALDNQQWDQLPGFTLAAAN
jgi:hypothetical protein